MSSDSANCWIWERSPSLLGAPRSRSTSELAESMASIRTASPGRREGAPSPASDSSLSRIKHFSSSALPARTSMDCASGSSVTRDTTLSRESTIVDSATASSTVAASAGYSSVALDLSISWMSTGASFGLSDDAAACTVAFESA